MSRLIDIAQIYACKLILIALLKSLNSPPADQLLYKLYDQILKYSEGQMQSLI